MMMVVRKGDATGVLGLVQILVSCGQFCCTVRQVKMTVNTYGSEGRCLKVVLPGSQNPKLIETFETRGSVMEVVKDYGFTDCDFVHETTLPG